MAEQITKIQDLRVGDIFLGPIGGWVGLAIGAGELLVDGGFHVGAVDVRHAGIVVTAEPGTRFGRPGYPNGLTDNFQLAQAMPSGAEITAMTYDRHWTDRCLFVRLPEDYEGQAADAAFIARAMVREKVAYSFASYAAIGLHHRTGGWPRLDEWINRRKPGEQLELPSGFLAADLLPEEAICSVFVDQAWTLAGKTMIRGISKQAVTPSQLGQALLATPGAVFGWPGDYPLAPVL